MRLNISIEKLSKVVGFEQLSSVPATAFAAVEAATYSVIVLSAQGKSEDERRRIEAEEIAWQIALLDKLLAEQTGQ